MIDKEKKIVVIGNGPSVLQNRFGDIINSFEEVVRINDYITSGFEDYVGSKTTIWARSNSNNTKDRNWEAYSKVIVISPEWNFNTIDRIIKGKNNAVVIPKDQSLALQKSLNMPGRVVKNGCKTQREWPSTGLLLLNYLLTEYPFIYIYGFDCFDKMGGKFAKHYYDSRDMKNCYVHNSDKEKKWINDNINKGVIIPLLELINV